MSKLKDEIMAAVMATTETMTDADQRSAIGMARTWIENGKPIARQNYHQAVYKRRDDLAETLVSIMTGHDPDDCVAALQAVRAAVNAPFIDPTMVGWQAARAARGMVGSVKKSEKQAGA